MVLMAPLMEINARRTVQVLPLPKWVPVILTFALIGIIKLALKMPTVRPAIAVVKSTRVARRAHANVTPQRVRPVCVLETAAAA